MGFIPEALLELVLLVAVLGVCWFELCVNGESFVSVDAIFSEGRLLLAEPLFVSLLLVRADSSLAL